MEKKEVIIKCLKIVKGGYFTQWNHLVSNGWLDSFEQIKLILELEKAFSIKIPVGRISPEDLNSIEQIENLIDNCLS